MFKSQPQYQMSQNKNKLTSEPFRDQIKPQSGILKSHGFANANTRFSKFPWFTLLRQCLLSLPANQKGPVKNCASPKFFDKVRPKLVLRKQEPVFRAWLAALDQNDAKGGLSLWQPAASPCQRG